MWMTDGKPFKYFSIAEMSNKLAEDAVKLSWTLDITKHGLMMDDLREWYGGPLEVSSWYRTKSFNDKLPGADPRSCHLDGIATDINNIPQSRFVECMKFWQYLCTKYGVIGGVGYYSWGMHFDSNNDPKRYGGNSSKFRVTDFRK